MPGTLIYLSNCAISADGRQNPFMMQELPWLMAHFDRVMMVSYYGVRTLMPGDEVVMLTDGVVDSYPGGEAGLREAIGKLAWLYPQAVGEKLIAQAVGDGQARDDMTVLCAKLTRSMME